MTNCIFCKIIAGDIPSYKIYEDEQVYAFLDLSQATKGHSLIVPKKHVADIFEYNAQLAGDVFARVPRIARALEKAFPEMAGLNIVSNNRELAYQSVFHSHIHLIPRYDPADDFSLHIGNRQEQFTNENMQEMANKIKAQVNQS